MDQIAADHDQTAEIDFGFDQVIYGPDVRDRMALVRADHDWTATDDSRFDWDSVS